MEGFGVQVNAVLFSLKDQQLLSFFFVNFISKQAKQVMLLEDLNLLNVGPQPGNPNIFSFRYYNKYLL